MVLLLFSFSRGGLTYCLWLFPIEGDARRCPRSLCFLRERSQSPRIYLGLFSPDYQGYSRAVASTVYHVPFTDRADYRVGTDSSACITVKQRRNDSWINIQVYYPAWYEPRLVALLVVVHVPIGTPFLQSVEYVFCRNTGKVMVVDDPGHDPCERIAIPGVTCEFVSFRTPRDVEAGREYGGFEESIRRNEVVSIGSHCLGVASTYVL